MGVVRLQLAGLVGALRPPPERALAALTCLLPALASDVYNGFMGAVSTATRKLQAVRGSLGDRRARPAVEAVVRCSSHDTVSYWATLSVRMSCTSEPR